MDIDLIQSALEQFHFIRPVWLWGLPVSLVLWMLLRNQGSGQQWSNHIPKEMLAALKIHSSKQSTLWKWTLLTLCFVAVVAAAGPAWDKQTAPTVQNRSALVLVLDLSPSMLAQDLSPDRLTLAKYKLIDVLRQQADGQAALIAYAGDAHTVSPLTDDPRTIEALLPALHPSVMPSRGSNTEAAISLAQQLLHDAGLSSGDILLISDGVTDDAIENITRSISSRYRLSVLSIGGNDAAPIPVTNGGFLRSSSGEIILSKVNVSELRAMASSLGGRFSKLTADDSDIKTLLIDGFEGREGEEAQKSSVVYDAWVDMGHWFVLIALPFALLLFRKGALYLAPLILPLLFLPPNDAMAASFSWNDLWQTKDQQGRDQYNSGEFGAAANSFDRKDWAALANYRNAAYEQTINKLSGSVDSTSLYNKGNALAFNGQFQEAIDAYDQALAQDSNYEDAAHNKKVIEQLMQQQEQNQQQGENSEDSSENESQENQSKGQQQNQQEGDGSESADESESEPEQGSQSSPPQDEQEKDSSGQQPQPEQDTEEQNNREEAESQEGDGEKESETTSEEQQASDAEEQQESDKQAESGAQVSDSREPLKDSSEQWLRAIQDDPSGLLRRKFDYQARERAQQGNRRTQKDTASERY